ncbi:MAG: hypothetical protein WAO41_08140 [Candidatus Nanopelagicales bacterium]
MHDVLFARRAELGQFQSIWIIPTVFLRDVVAALAILAGQGDLGPNVTRLGHVALLVNLGRLADVVQYRGSGGRT